MQSGIQGEEDLGLNLVPPCALSIFYRTMRENRLSRRCTEEALMEGFRLVSFMEMWKKKHNMFGILYSWFLAKASFVFIALISNLRWSSWVFFLLKLS